MLNSLHASAQRCICKIEFIVDTLDKIIYTKLNFYISHLEYSNIIIFDQVVQIVRVKIKLSEIGKQFNVLVLEFPTSLVESKVNLKKKENLFLHNIFQLYEKLLLALSELDKVLNGYNEIEF